MTLLRMDNVLIVVDDLKAAIAFFAELGLELEGETTVEGQWVDRVVGLDGVRSDIAMMRTPDGHGWLELAKFHTPKAVRAEPRCHFARPIRVPRTVCDHHTDGHSRPRAALSPGWPRGIG